MDHSYRILQPRYVQKFQCDINKCDEDCCHGWIIHVEKTVCHSYLVYPDREVRKKLLGALKKTKFESRYAELKLNAQNRCPHFMKNGLCYIHRNLGEKYLPAICETFPRQYFFLGGKLIRTLDISCPIAAHLLFESEKAMELKEVTEDRQIREEMVFSFDIKNSFIEALQPYAFILLEFSLYCMQSISFFCLEEKFAAIGLLLEETVELMNKKQLTKLPQIIADCKTADLSGIVRSMLEEINAKPKERLRISLQMIDYLFLSFSYPYLQQCKKMVAEGLNLEAEINLTQLLKHYKQMSEIYYQPVYRQAPYILSNYFANLFLMEIFPLKPGQNLRQNYLTVVMLWLTIETILVGLAAYYKESFSVQHIIKVLRALDHTRVSMKALPQKILDEISDDSLRMSLSILKPIR